MRKFVFGLVALMVCTGAAADVEVRFFDEGSLIVGAHVSVLMENPTPTAEKLAPSSDGTYIVGADVGSKITFQVQSGIPVGVTITAQLTYYHSE